MKKIGKHSFQIFDSTIKRHQNYGAHSYNYKVLIPLILNHIEQGLPMTHWEIIKNLVEYVNILPSRKLAHESELRYN